MLRKIRILLALFFFIAITALFLDISSILPEYFGWMAKVQFLPALLSMNIVIVVGLVLFTLLFGRLYCSIICPLGVMQDLFSHLSARRNKNRFLFKKAKPYLRYLFLALFVLLLIFNVAWLAAIIEPYSSYGRIVTNLLSPLYVLGNNLLAFWAERLDSSSFYTVELFYKGTPILLLSALTLLVVAFLAWRGGRTWCNTVCPVGTILGFLSRFSLFAPMIDTKKCSTCHLCERKCKASCIDSKHHLIDYSRCVVCMDCIDNCKQGAVHYGYKGWGATKKPVDAPQSNEGRRTFLSAGALLAASLVKSQTKKVDGGLAVLAQREVPARNVPVLPAGAKSLRHFSAHCTACQLCVSKCPNEVLRPSSQLSRFMQPELSFERGYCRVGCNACSEVCPTGAIKKIDLSQKSAIKTGTAVWIAENCIAERDGVSCGNCQRHCPSGAITMITKEGASPDSPKIPMIDVERCIGCGNCEFVCPARPFSAIYVEGVEVQREV